MLRSPGKSHRIARRIGIIVLLTVIGFGCGPALTFYASRLEPRCHAGDENCEKFPYERNRFAGDLARKFGAMAYFAHEVYRRDLGAGKTACSYLNGDVLDKDHGMPRTEIGRWTRWDGRSKDGQTTVKPCLAKDGLYYETYVFTHDKDGMTEAIIAFRGTDGLDDWLTNLAAMFAFQPPQYRDAREEIPAIIALLKKENPNVKIYAVGHSLGGGLAQQAGYLSRNIDEVFTFNTSPVTNWSWLRIDRAIDNPSPTIYRLFHGGEILEKVRFVTTSVTAARYGRIDIGVQFKERRSIDGHEMLIFVCGFGSVLMAQSDLGEADHHLSAKYLSETKFAKGGDCNNEQGAVSAATQQAAK
jgi:hypothetical protein